MYGNRRFSQAIDGMVAQRRIGPPAHGPVKPQMQSHIPVGPQGAPKMPVNPRAAALRRNMTNMPV